MKKFLLAALAAWVVGSQALAEVAPEWKEIDVNGDGTLETVATTNLSDIAFNQKGELVGWYEKLWKGTNYAGNYNGKPSILQNGVLSGTIPLTGAVQAEKPQTSIEKTADGGAFLTGVFKYTQGGVRVSKRYVINSRRLTVQLEVQASGTPSY
ncbi:MAG: hypothetical protein ACK41E_08075, partial [Deinococcales bacterium]